MRLFFIEVDEMLEPYALEPLKAVLASVLAAGNYMNGGTPRGRAYGYKLDMMVLSKSPPIITMYYFISLFAFPLVQTKLDTIKPVTGNKGTLLHYIVEKHLEKYVVVNPAAPALLPTGIFFETWSGRWMGFFTFT